MGFLYVQTWVISKGKTKEHDECMKKILQNAREKYEVLGFKTMPRAFSQRYGPMGARVFILEFDSDDDFRSFWEKHERDKETIKLRDEWRTYIDPSSWRAVFWNEITAE